MPEDIYFDENFLTETDKVGDIRTVRDESFYEQTVTVSVVEDTPNTPVGFTPTALEDRRSAIESAVRDNQFTEPPITVTIAETNETTQTVTFEVTTSRVSLPITQ
jgi:hypothetical protein